MRRGAGGAWIDAVSNLNERAYALAGLTADESRIVEDVTTYRYGVV